MKIEILGTNCNLDTVRDGRGGIFTWYPKEPIVEVNMLYFTAGSHRGYHYHPEFVEYFLVVEGTLVLITKDSPEAPEEHLHMTKGTFIRTPKGIPHAYHAITPVIAIAMLSNKWNDSNPPIIHAEYLEQKKSKKE